MLKRVAYALAIVAILAAPAFAQETHAKVDTSQNSYVALAMGLGIAIAAFGGALGQGRAIGSAVESVARQPEAGGRIQGMMIIGLALIETLVIYALVVCFLLLGKFVG